MSLAMQAIFGVSIQHLECITTESRVNVAARRAAQHGVPADRFAREIAGFLKASSSALAAPEHQTVGPPLCQP